MNEMDKIVAENLRREPVPDEIWVCSTSRQYFHENETTDYCCVGGLIKFIRAPSNPSST